MIPNSLNFKFTRAALILVLLVTSWPSHAKHILVYGDSLSAAYGMDIEQGWVHLLSEQWQGQHTITNASISGETTQGGLQRLPLTLERVKPDIVMVELGANDGLRGSKISQIRQNLTDIVELTQASGAQVIVAGISLPASYGPRYIEQFRTLFTSVAEERNAAYFDLYDEDFVSTEGYIQADGLHPTAITQPIIRDNVARFFEDQKLLD